MPKKYHGNPKGVEHFKPGPIKKVDVPNEQKPQHAPAAYLRKHGGRAGTPMSRAEMHDSDLKIL